MVLIQDSLTLVGDHFVLVALDTPSSVLLEQVRLSEHEMQFVQGVQVEARKREYLTARLLVQHEYGTTTQITYNEVGKPSLSNGVRISLSHSRGFLGVLFSDKREVGLDIQVHSPKISRIAKKFVSVLEYKFIPAASNEDYYHVLWCAKEALFKWYALGGLQFDQELIVKPFILEECGFIEAEVRKAGAIHNVRLSYEKFENLWVVYTLK